MSLPKPYYQDEAVTIYHADCQEILPYLGPVDLVLTDPPYGVQYVSSWRTRTDPLVAPITGDDTLGALQDALPCLDRVLFDGRHIYVFASHRMIGLVSAAVEVYWPIKNVLIWDKGDAGSVGDLEAGYGVNWEAIIYASKGRRALNGPRPRAIYRYDWSGLRDPVHPAVKPVGLLKWLVSKSSEGGETVLDPFMGSGTTLRAAKDLGRKAIGIEIEEKYCRIAAERMSQGVLL